MRTLFSFSLIIMLATIFFMSAVTVNAQQENPVHWEITTQKVDNNHINLVMNATIDSNWHLYTINMAEGGPMPLVFDFEPSQNYKPIGGIQESPEPIKSYDDVFEVDVKYQEKKATYTQKFKVLTNDSFTIKGEIDGQACFDDGQCVLVFKDIAVDVEQKPASATNAESEKQDIKADTTDKNDTINQTDNQVDEEITHEKDTSVIAQDDTAPTPEKKENNSKNKGLLVFVLIAIGAGLAGVLTPCVFPMIPMTVSFFMQGTQNKLNTILKAVVFGISIMLLYTIIGLIVSLTSAGADLTTTLSTSWVANSIFFLLFIIFAISFFGAFEIVLPSGLANKADQQVDKGGMLASFFMALTLVIVSFSCTGPIVGALLVKGAASGSWIEPTIGMAGFGFGFALPFTILAISPGWMKKLPKSGGWMNSVKVVFAFILLAFSMKFLSNIDQANNLNILSRDLYLAIWIVLFTLLGAYLLGKIRFPHDTEIKHIGFFRLLLAIVSLSFAVYLVPGLFGAQLTSISSILPPPSAQKFELTNTGSNIPAGSEVEDILCDDPLYSDFLEYPHGIHGYFDYEQARQCAIEQEKPLLLYFTGHSCSNCKKMQAEVWSDPEVIKYFNNELIITKLYVDERYKLAEEFWYTSEVDGKIKKTIGKMNMDRQIRDFDVISQPFYIMINPQTEAILTEKPMLFETNPDIFIDFLNAGIKVYES
ncbi:MAG: cytochrome c biogenesis protein CcdA [Bacteroidota bacterium]|nr:cytochrome c biogenesis protein CcdA [Bacteroidota bacterium]